MRLAALALVVALPAAAFADEQSAPPPQTPPSPPPQPPTPPGSTPSPLPATTGAADRLPTTRCLGYDVPVARFSEIDAGIHIGAWAALDATVYGSSNPRDDSFGFTDFRPIVEGRTGPFSLRVEADVIGVDTPRNLYEAYAAWQATPWLRASAGQFRVALGSEFEAHESESPFIGYGFASHLDGRYDTGLRLDGTVIDGLWYQAAAVTGHGFDLDGHRRTSPQVSVRGVIHPLRVVCARDEGLPGLLRGFHFGMGYAHLSDGDDPVHLWNPLGNPVFDTPDLDGDGGQWVHTEFGFVTGPFQLGYERTVGSIDNVAVPGGEANMDQLTGFAVGAALNLTGEPRGWRDGAFVPATAPRKAGEGLLPCLPDGRWEAALRYSNGDIDRDLFDAGYTNYQISSQETRTVTAAIFWEPCENVRFGLEWVKTHLDHEIASFGFDNRDSSFVLRLELRF